MLDPGTDECVAMGKAGARKHDLVKRADNF
jgi:hypothetical protein